MWRLPKTSSVFFKDHIILGSILGPTDFGKVPCKCLKVATVTALLDVWNGGVDPCRSSHCEILSKNPYKPCHFCLAKTWPELE